MRLADFVGSVKHTILAPTWPEDLSWSMRHMAAELLEPDQLWPYSSLLISGVSDFQSGDVVFMRQGPSHAMPQIGRPIRTEEGQVIQLGPHREPSTSLGGKARAWHLDAVVELVAANRSFEWLERVARSLEPMGCLLYTSPSPRD